MARSIRSKAGPSRTARRREELRRALPKPTGDVRVLVRQPEVVYAAGVTVLFLALVSLLLIWSRDQIKVEAGQIMTDTRLNRLDYTVPDHESTNVLRQAARDSAAHVYTLNSAYLEQLAGALNGLPKAIAGKTSIEDISEDLVADFQLTDEALEALAPYAEDAETGPKWRKWVTTLIGRLEINPLVKSDEWQNYWSQRGYVPRDPVSLKRILRRPGGGMEEFSGDASAVELHEDNADKLMEHLRKLVFLANFPPAVSPYVTARLARDPQPTILFDPETSTRMADQATEAVETVLIEHRGGEVIYRRGDVLTAKQHQDLNTEAAAFATDGGTTERWLPRLGVMGFAAIAAIFVIGYAVLFYPRIARNPLRLLAICLLMTGMLALTAMVGARAPSSLYLGAVAPTLFVGIVALLAYDQRIALFLSATQCALATLALDQGMGMFVLLFTGCGTALAQLREMRNRSTLIQASAITSVVLAAAAVLLGSMVTPLAAGAITQIGFNALLAGLGGFAVGFVVLGILPSLERWFDITTGMTLAELRDPKQPLLRQLQQKAPGTYNHSLQVANIAEAAAATIGANGLLVYVGALYHDIGKMNKPEYFVENQTDGASKHAKLSPAMSLLVIVGHVKDGIELAREYGLPRSIQHFIESHHGTTLVEYFYHAAKSQAEIDDRGSVEEIEFRYPGPKPRAKEAAILMLADCVESATRSMAEPTPSRIETLVRQLSRKRLMDGQYDQCDLTFRELGLIEESTIKSLCAIYHGRISYPSTSQTTGEREVPKQATA
ncbi:MAG: HD family phosphohydrolase [Planctomycetota bacterium]|jgi:putative nucleotidyltransferase with HDIG domain